MHYNGLDSRLVSHRISTGEIVDRSKMSTPPFNITVEDCDCFYKVIATFPSAIILLNISMHIHFCNQTTEKLFFCKNDDVPGKNLPFIAQYQKDDFAENIKIVAIKINGNNLQMV